MPGLYGIPDRRRYCQNCGIEIAIRGYLEKNCPFCIEDLKRYEDEKRKLLLSKENIKKNRKLRKETGKV